MKKLKESLNKVVKVHAKVLVKHDHMKEYVYFNFDFIDLYPALYREDFFRKDMEQSIKFIPSVENMKIETIYKDMADSEMLDKNFHPADHFTIN